MSSSDNLTVHTVSPAIFVQDASKPEPIGEMCTVKIIFGNSGKPSVMLSVMPCLLSF